MASLSVKDRAKMFGNLASPDNAAKDRSYRRIGNKVTSSPFRSASPTSASTNSKVPSSPFSKSKTASTAKTEATPLNSRNRDRKDSSKFDQKKDNINWPDEEGIPAPTSNKIEDSSSKNVTPVRISLKPVVASSSPLTVLSNKDTHRRPPSLNSYQSKMEIGQPVVTKNPNFERKVENFNSQKKSRNSGDNTVEMTPNMERQQSKPKMEIGQPLVTKIPNFERKVENFNSQKKSRNSGDYTVEVTLNMERQQSQPQNLLSVEKKEESQNDPVAKEEKSVVTAINTKIESNNPSQQHPTSKDNEENFPVSGNARSKATRAMRFRKAKRATKLSTLSKNSKQSLHAAKVVMQEEKSDVGASEASSRSSLTNKELSDIAKRALQKLKDESQDEKRNGNQFNLNVTQNSEARRALLSITASKSRGTYSSRSERLGLKDSQAVAIENSSQTKATENTSISPHSEKPSIIPPNDSTSGRRMDHPAFAGRTFRSNVSSIHVLTSYQKFNATRPKEVANNLNAKSKAIAETLNSDFENELQNELQNELKHSFSDDNSLISSTSMASMEQEEMMHEMDKHPFYLNKQESMRSTSERQEESKHSISGREEKSIHSMRGREDHFHRIGKINIYSKNNCNDTVVSSLSGNTQSLQSTMSQSITSKMKSPANKSFQKSSKLLEPTPEDSTQTLKSEILAMLSPGPSNRSGHSFANSIISASPRVEYTTMSFMDTLEEKLSSSQESKGNSAELLDAALEAAIEDMDIIDSPRTNPSVCLQENSSNEAEHEALSTKSTLPSSLSVRSQSPPGFVFEDTEESDANLLPDPIGIDPFGANDTSISNSGENGPNSGQITEQGISTSTHAVDVNNVNQISQKQGSSSTSKRTVSTSIRSGMSSIQNEGIAEGIKSNSVEGVEREIYEGSTSIRTGLSGLQNQKDSIDNDNSISIRMNKSIPMQTNEASATTPSEGKEKIEIKQVGDHDQQQAFNSSPQYPDTIQEENEEKSTQKSTITAKDDNTLTSGLKARSTATTDRSSGTTTGSSSSPDQLVTDENIGNGNANMHGNIILPPLQTEENAGDEVSNMGFSLLSPGSRSSRPWKNSLGKSIGNAIKTVLAKASPRGSGHTSIFSNQSKQKGNEECGSLFTDDDDDIFGGLEVQQDEEKKEKALTPKKQMIDPTKTPKQMNSNSNDKVEKSTSRRTNNSLSRRTNESFSRRANGSLSRKLDKPNTRESIKPGSKSKRKSHTSGTPLSSALKKRPSTPSQKKRNEPSPAAAATRTVPTKSLRSNDRSGMLVDESEVVHNVFSDITSSLIGGPISGYSPYHRNLKNLPKFTENSDKKHEENEISKDIPEEQYPKKEAEGSFTVLMEETDVSTVEQKVPEPALEFEDEKLTVDETKSKEEDQQNGYTFLNFSCGLVDPCGGFVNLCTPSKKVDDDPVEETVVGDDTDIKDCVSVGSRSELTTLEKKVWNEWDRLNNNLMSTNNKNRATNDDSNEDYDKLRETAQDELLDIANAALSPQESVKSKNSSPTEDDSCAKTNSSEGPIISVSESTESGFTNGSASGASGDSFGFSSGESGSQGSTSSYSTSYSSDEESDAKSKDPSRSAKRNTPTQSTGPLLLSFSQRSLMEKFSKQLTAVGVQVLKLNTRKQWQTRIFTVSTEQIALSAHEAISKSGEIAQCPKALLWLKKFNPKNGGYNIGNIDKDGHGGMLLVDLVDIQVCDRQDDMLGNPIPKKLQDIFENSVLVTLKYKMKGILRSIEFRCRDNDEAQFLCTCMRVIRDLLRRERSLRQKLSRQLLSNQMQMTPSSSRRRR